MAALAAFAVALWANAQALADRLNAVGDSGLGDEVVIIEGNEACFAFSTLNLECSSSTGGLSFEVSFDPENSVMGGVRYECFPEPRTPGQPEQLSGEPHAPGLVTIVGCFVPSENVRATVVVTGDDGKLTKTLGYVTRPRAATVEEVERVDDKADKALKEARKAGGPLGGRGEVGLSYAWAPNTEERRSPGLGFQVSAAGRVHQYFKLGAGVRWLRQDVWVREDLNPSDPELPEDQLTLVLQPQIPFNPAEWVEISVGLELGATQFHTQQAVIRQDPDRRVVLANDSTEWDFTGGLIASIYFFPHPSIGLGGWASGLVRPSDEPTWHAEKSRIDANAGLGIQARF